ncbi:MAG: diguanylate cyclase domain-containing protein [Actinomycetes bacterium]
MPSTRTTVAAGAAALVVGAFVLFLVVGDASGHTVLVVNNLLQTVSALVAGLVCAAVAVWGSTGRRTGWLFMGVALVGWGLGQAYWSWSEIVAKAETPFPSLADLGFLVFPVAAAVAVLQFQRGTSDGRARLRAASDGAIVSTALFLLSWALVLEPVYAAGGDSAFAFAVALAYPIGDLIVVSLVFLLLSRMTGNRAPILVLSAGLLAMSVADSGFAYLSTAGSYHTGSIVDVGWVAAFLLCAVAAVCDMDGSHRTNEFAGVTKIALFLPLLPFVAGTAVLAVEAWSSRMDHMLVVAGILLLVLISARQMLVLTENGQLVATVHQREEQLRHQAFHDPLTGLANRLLFRDRLEHAASLRPRTENELTVLFLDLDDFKLVNDRLGHAAGDALLVDVAERLRACLRKGDTVARLGGDEFAVLLQEGYEGPEQLAQRIVAAMEMPFQLGAQRVQVTGSVGVATLSVDTEEAQAVSDRLLQCADVAMYSAKRGHKGSYVVWQPAMRMDGTHSSHLPDPQSRHQSVQPLTT